MLFHIINNKTEWKIDLFFVLLQKFCSYCHFGMQYLGELISLGVACSWTVTAIVSEIGTKRIGVLHFNVWRLFVAFLFTLVMVFFLTGNIGPAYAGKDTWFWMGLSGFVGFFLGDFCLFKSYVYISSRYGQLFMTLAPAAAAVVAWMMLGEKMSVSNLLAMAVTLAGIMVVVAPSRSKDEASDGKQMMILGTTLRNGIIGALYGVGAGLGQGFGLVLSKIGMEHYEQDIPVELFADLESSIPFSANMIRCIVGGFCFLLVVLLGGKGRELVDDVHDKQAMKSMLLAVLFGPFLGVAFSLMAVQYTQVGIAQTIMAIVPILIILPSYWIFKQPITAKGVIGAVISVMGVSLFFLI